MEKKKKRLIERISDNLFVRNLILAVCTVVVFIFLVNILLNLFTRHNVHKDVPDFKGMNITEVYAAARKDKLKIEVNDSLFVPAYEGGMVLDQSPAPGTQVKPGRRIFVTVNSYNQKMVKIPYVTGYSLRQAKNIIEVAGLEIEKLVYKSDMATNNVLEERYGDRVINPGSTLEAEIGSGITLVVGLGADATWQAVPKVVGFPLKEAKSRLWEVGLNVGKITFDKDIDLMNQHDARVYLQTPEQARKVSLGSSVALRLTLDTDKVEKGSAASDKQAKSIMSAQQKLDDVIDDVVTNEIRR